jgi:hypothetical protein
MPRLGLVAFVVRHLARGTPWRSPGQVSGCGEDTIGTDGSGRCGAWGDNDGVETDELIGRIRAKAVAAGPVPAPASRDAVAELEDQLGLRLPGLLVRIYTEVADGGFGPGTDVSIPGYDVARLYPLRRLVEVYQDNRSSDPAPYAAWPAGVVPMLFWGCFAEAAIDCLDDQAPVLLHESDVEEVAPQEAWKVDAPSLAEWWQRWVDGTRPQPTTRWRPRP